MEGIGILVIDSITRVAALGDVIKIPRNIKHAIKVNEELYFVEVQIGDELTESDITRHECTW